MPFSNYEALSLNPSGFTRTQKAFKLFDISPSTGYRRINEGRFPKPIKISIGISANRNSDLLEFATDPVNYKAKDAS